VAQLCSTIEASGGPYLLGEHISIVDLAYLPFVLRFDTVLRDTRSFDLRRAGDPSGECMESCV
jgi:glutathione S-transferase